MKKSIFALFLLAFATQANAANMYELNKTSGKPTLGNFVIVDENGNTGNSSLVLGAVSLSGYATLSPSVQAALTGTAANTSSTAANLATSVAFNTSRPVTLTAADFPGLPASGNITISALSAISFTVDTGNSKLLYMTLPFSLTSTVGASSFKVCVLPLDENGNMLWSSPQPVSFYAAATTMGVAQPKTSNASTLNILSLCIQPNSGNCVTSFLMNFFDGGANNWNVVDKYLSGDMGAVGPKHMIVIYNSNPTVDYYMMPVKGYRRTW